MNDPIQDLFGKYTEGSITADEVRALEAYLRTDEALKEEFLEHINVNVALEEHPDYPLYEESDLFPRVSDGAWWQPAPGWSRAAAASVVLLLVLGVSKISQDPGSVSAMVLRNDEAVVRGSELQFTLGEQVAIEEIDLEKGWLRLELPKGVVFDIYGPAKGRFLSSERFELDAGRLNVDVGPLGKGFTVVTEHADIVDLGTQFGVDVNGDSRAKVAVFSGEVEIHSRENESVPRLLEEGEGLRLDSAMDSSRLMSVNVADEQRPNRRLSEDDNIFQIRDNLTANESLRFYGIVSDGMREGVRTYTTHQAVRWWSDEGEPFPNELSGADLIQPFHRDRFETDLEIQLEAVEDATVYVLFDERYVTPDWLPDGLSDTGRTVRSGPWRPEALVTRDITPDANGEIYIRYRVWQTSVAAGESVILGESKNRDRVPGQTWRVMYGIAVQSRY